MVDKRKSQAFSIWKVGNRFMVKSLTFPMGFSGKTLPNRLGMVEETLSSSWQKAIPYSQG
jgi:hypothetical protein